MIPHLQCTALSTCNSLAGVQTQSFKKLNSSDSLLCVRFLLYHLLWQPNNMPARVVSLDIKCNAPVFPVASSTEESV